jgi:hypothetical protein
MSSSIQPSVAEAALGLKIARGVGFHSLLPATATVMKHETVQDPSVFGVKARQDSRIFAKSRASGFWFSQVTGLFGSIR